LPYITDLKERCFTAKVDKREFIIAEIH